MVCPVIQPAISEHRSTTALPMSAGVPTPHGCPAALMVLPHHGLHFRWERIHGLMALTVMPRFASAQAKYRTSDSSAAFAVPCAM